MKKDRVWVILAAIALGIGVASSWYVAPPKISSDYAAWIQAFGSIGAILIAIQISRSETQRQKTNTMNEAKVKLILEGESIYEIHDSLRKASKAASDFLALWESQGTSGNPAFNYHMTAARESLAKALQLAQKINWELFLVAMPEKAKDIKLVLFGFSYLKRQTNLQGLVVDEMERDRIHFLLVAYESLLKNEEFITLKNR